ncbi:MAG: hypothetical protein J0H74_15415 [Chitinophagaceae bacterium]|nr:hypothetical protein [Chitinophagaceae bacterium]
MKVNSGATKQLPAKKKKERPISIPASQNNELPAPGRSPLAYLIHIWIFIPALLFFKVASEHAVNIPIMDDYDAILDFLHNFRLASFWEKICLLFSQHNEHRLFHSRVLYVSYYYLFGDINFRNIILIGDLQLVVIFPVSIYFIRKATDKYWSILAFIWALCIFDLNTYGSGVIAMASVQNYGIVMLFFVTLFLYSLKRKYLIPAALFQIVCIFSSGNGILASLLVVIYVLFSNDKTKKIVSASIAVVFSPLYFLHYIKPAAEPAEPGGFNVSTAVSFIIKMAGAPLDFNNALLLGILVLVILAAVFPYKSVRSNSNILPLVFIAAFCLATMLATGYFRSNLKGVLFQTSRYLTYPQLLLASICFFIFLKLKGKKAQLPVVIVLLAIMLKVYMGNFAFGRLGFERESLRAKNYKYYYPDEARAGKIIQEANDASVYSLLEER